MSATDRAVHRLEALPLDGGVGVKPHEETIGGSEDRMRQLTAAKPTQHLSVFRVSVVKFAVIVTALLMRLHFKVVELQFNAMAGCRGKMPRAVFPAGVKIGPIGTAYFSFRICNLVLTTALFTVHLILVKREPVVTVALERPDGILANVLTAAVFHRALVAIREEKRLESGLLDRIIGVEFDPHEIGLGSDDGRKRRPAKDAVNGGIGAAGTGNGRRSRNSGGAENDVAAHVSVRGRIMVRRGPSASHFQRVVFTVLIVAFQIEMGKVERDSILRRRLDLPNAVFVRRIQFREGRRGDGAVDGFDVPAASVFAPLSIRVKFESDATLAFVPA